MGDSAHALMENRNRLLFDFRVDEANGHAEDVTPGSGRGQPVRVRRTPS